MTNSNPFRDALDWFGPNGERWVKAHAFIDGGACMSAAVNALVVTYDRVAAGEFLEGIVRELAPGRATELHCSARPVIAFNDHPTTTWADVKQVLEIAATRWDARATAYNLNP